MSFVNHIYKRAAIVRCLGLLTAIFLPCCSFAQQRDPAKSGEKGGVKTYTPEEAYHKLTSNLEKDLIEWRNIRITVLKIESDLKLLDVRLRDSTRYKNAIGDSRSYDEVNKSITSMKANLEDFNTNHLKPAKESFDRTSKIIINKFDRMSDNTRSSLNTFVEKDYDKVKKNLAAIKGSDNASIARREAYGMYKRHLEELGKSFLVIDDSNRKK